MTFLGVIDAIYQWVSQPPSWLLMVIPLLWDVSRRLFPTLKPASFFHDMGNIMSKIGALLSKLGEFIDNIAPQNLSQKDDSKG